MIRRIFTAVLTIAVATTALAYDAGLHRRISRKAIAVAAGQNNFVQRLGMTPADAKIAFDYVEQGGFEQDLVSKQTPANHFFDPYDIAPLTVPAYWYKGWIPCSITFVPADKWALDRSYGNSFAIQAAGDYLREAIIGPNPGTRGIKMNFAFYTLGHVIHLIEDMAQPEHTRNDQHLSLVIPSTVVLSNGTAPSIWESWSEANIAAGPDAYFSNYPVVKLPAYEDYFTDKAGRGMADYSNRNFFTQDTNEYDERPKPPATSQSCYVFNNPVADASRVRTIQVTEQYFVGPFTASSAVWETYYTGDVDDHYTGAQDTDGAQTVESLLDFETRQYGVNTFSLNESSYQTRSSLLIPRAVGYSAGLIDHFFRGRIDAKWELVPNAYTWNLTITNRSSEPIGADAQLDAVFKTDPSYFGRTNSDDTGFIFHAPLAAWIDNFTGIQPGQSVTIPNIGIYDLKTDDPITKFERRLFLRSTLGTTPNEVIALVQPPQVKHTAYWDFDNWTPLKTAEDLDRMSFSSGGYYTTSPRNRMLMMYGFGTVADPYTATTGNAEANWGGCYRCVSYWNGGWSVMAWDTPVDNVQFDIANGVKTRSAKIDIQYLDFPFYPYRPPFTHTLHLTLAPGEHQTVKIPMTGVRQVWIGDVTPGAYDFYWAMDNLSFDYYDE